MKKEQILELLDCIIEPDREYEFWYNPETSEFAGVHFFATKEREVEFDREWNFMQKVSTKKGDTK